MKKIKYIFPLIWIFFIVAQVFSATSLESVQQYLQNRLHPEETETIKPCGFRAQFELQQHFNQLNPEMQAFAKTLLSEPVRSFSMTSPAGHFILHYDTSGLHAVDPTDLSGNGIPDYIDSAAVIFDHVWQVEIEQMGFKVPPDANGNLVSGYPIYFTNFGYYGMTWFGTGLPGNRYSSYIEIHRNFAGGFYTHGLEALKVTAAHEFNHAIQLGYRFENNNDIFFMEMTSTWLEDYVYEDVNDYLQYLPSFFSTMTDRKFNASNGEYANSLYLHMIEKEYGPKAVVKIWENIVSYPPVKALDGYLKDAGSSFAKSQNNYAVWLYFTGGRTQGDAFFPEAADYPQLHPRSGTNNAEKALPYLSMRYVYLEADSGLIYRGKISAAQNSGRFNFLGSGQLQQEAQRFGQWQTFRQFNHNPLLLVMTNPETETTLTDIAVWLKIAPPALDSNPIIVEQNEGQAVFYNVPPQSAITIFTVNGRPVRTLRFQQEETGTLEWNLKDRFGHRVSSGIYLYFINGSEPVLGKFAIVR